MELELGTGFDRYRLRARREAARSGAIRPEEVEGELRAVLSAPGAEAEREALRRFLFEQEVPVHARDDDALLRECGRLARADRLFLYRDRAEPRQARARGGSRRDEPPPPDAARLTWISVELTDDRSRPMPFEPYRLTLPDGGVRAGRLDAQGKMRLEGIPAGECQITFPDLEEGMTRPRRH